MQAADAGLLGANPSSQRHPVHPSPPSHSSNPSTALLPQFETSQVPQAHKHVAALQGVNPCFPCAAFQQGQLLPSSQSSVPSTRALPQTGLTHLPLLQ